MPSFSRAIIPFTLPIGKEKDFRGVVDVVHMKAYELGADGQAKEIDTVFFTHVLTHLRDQRFDLAQPV